MLACAGGLPYNERREDNIKSAPPAGVSEKRKTMKLLSVTVPCYNSQDYMRHCVDVLLQGGDEVEIPIVDDGSSDNTAAIADEYQQNYPGIVRAIHQPNGGHGAAVMTGVKNAQGLYFKVVDSDDWLDDDAYAKVLDTLRRFAAEGNGPDLLVSNYVYEKVSANLQRPVRYTGALPENKMITWDEVGHFRKGQYMLMHAVIYRTQLLRDCGLDLPRHTFYVDNLFVYVPMASVKTLYYLNVDLYRYFIGRDDQSVQEQVMIRRIDQQLRVNRMMLEQVQLARIANKRQQSYMYNYLEIITTVSSVLCIRSGSEENLKKKADLWQMIHDKHPWEYRRLRRGIMGRVMNMDSRPGRWLAVTAYKISQKLVGFN